MPENLRNCQLHKSLNSRAALLPVQRVFLDELPAERDRPAGVAKLVQRRRPQGEPGHTRDHRQNAAGHGRDGGEAALFEWRNYLANLGKR